MDLERRFVLALIQWLRTRGYLKVAQRLEEVYQTGSPTQRKRMADATAIAGLNMNNASADSGINLFLTLLDKKLSSEEVIDEWLDGALKTVVAINQDTIAFPDPRSAFIEKILWALFSNPEAESINEEVKQLAGR
jgi:hypothetical protein